MTISADALPAPSRALLLDDGDNVLVAACSLAAGDAVWIDGAAVALPQPVALGHKIARRPLARGAVVLRHGAPIGRATQPIAIGEHVHTHNLASDYIPTYTLDEGHRFVASPRTAP